MSLPPAPAVAAEARPPHAAAGGAAGRTLALSGAQSLNLARRPFVNSRPVTRAALLLWLLGALLLAGNVSLFWSYLESSQETRVKLAKVESDTAAERQKISALSGQISGLNLDQENRQVAYLNRKIAERAFSWSQLFDRIAEVLPQGVRLLRLSPQNVVEKESGGRQTGPPAEKTTPITLLVTGQAKSDEALSQFVDKLFAHPSFAEPNLAHEAREEDNLLRFDLKVLYIPDAPKPAAVAADGSAASEPAPAAGGEAAIERAPAAGGGASIGRAPAAGGGAVLGRSPVAGGGAVPGRSPAAGGGAATKLAPAAGGRAAPERARGGAALPWGTSSASAPASLTHPAKAARPPGGS
ncbi:MAG TPA: PilN domain-containing protein [Thermoanaerobaculia bacterium]|nr:PilN domain-containing protein [Thermoanaerobaculia bacterium]